MINGTFDSGSVQGFIASCLFISLGEVSQWVGSIDLQTVSYSVAILVGIDTLTGSPIKNAFKKFWSKFNG
jgi:hypothetical protein